MKSFCIEFSGSEASGIPNMGSLQIDSKNGGRNGKVATASPKTIEFRAKIKTCDQGDIDSHGIYHICLPHPDTFVCLIFIRWITLPTEPSSEARSTTTAPSRRSWLAWPCCSTSPRSEQLSTQPRASLILSADWKPVHFNEMLPHYTVRPVCSQF